MNQRFRQAITLFMVAVLSLLSVASISAVIPANDDFQRTWERTDKPVSDLAVSRTWMWGPSANTTALLETYAESPGGMREVQYFDKSRMEINNPNAVRDLWYVTNGLLVDELIRGRIQVGDNQWLPAQPASIPVAGDADDINGPTYAALANVLDADPLAEGVEISWRINSFGAVSLQSPLTGHGVTAAFFDAETSHTVASPFWTFMNSSGTVWENGANVSANLFQNPFYATGRPITEAYWATVKVGGEVQDVLLQCFERRCLTYTPRNADGWKVEAGNVGQHYHAWRYDQPEHDPTGWHPPTTHEHGDKPPEWADAWSLQHFGHPVMFGGDEATPMENHHKHEAYKGYAFTVNADNGQDIGIYVRLHMASNPHERATRYHSYEMYALDDQGNVSFWQGWLDFGPAPDNRDTHDDGSVFELIPAYFPSNHIIGWSEGENTHFSRSFNAFETGQEFWYAQVSSDDGWEPIFLIDIYDPATYTHPDTEHLNAIDRSTWLPTGDYGIDRRISVRWVVEGARTLTVAGRPYLERNLLNPRGWFCSTTTGQITGLDLNGPSECTDGLPQHIAVTMPTLGDTRSASVSYHNQWDCPNCTLPN